MPRITAAMSKIMIKRQTRKPMFFAISVDVESQMRWVLLEEKRVSGFINADQFCIGIRIKWLDWIQGTDSFHEGRRKALHHYSQVHQRKWLQVYTIKDSLYIFLA